MRRSGIPKVGQVDGAGRSEPAWTILNLSFGEIKVDLVLRLWMALSKSFCFIS